MLEGCDHWTCDQLAVIDTQSGHVLSTTPIPGRVHYKRYPIASRMAVSSDGGSVYVLKWQGPPAGSTPVALAVFDTVGERFLDGEIDLGTCGFATFVPTADHLQLAVHCSSSNELAIHRLTAPDRAVLALSIHLPWGKRVFAGPVYGDVPARAFMPSADRRRLFVVRADGAISEVTLSTGNVVETRVRGNENESVVPFASPGALKPARFFVGVSRRDGQGTAQEIRIFDASTWARVGTIRTSTPFVSAVATDDGSVIYALTGEYGKLLTIDPAAGRELSAMPLGRAPSLALVAP